MNLKLLREQSDRLCTLLEQADDAARSASAAQGVVETLLKTLNPDDAKAGQQLQSARADTDLAALRISRTK